MKIIKILTSFVFLINCFSYELKDYGKTIEKDIIWIHVKSQNNLTNYKISDINNLTLKIAKKLQKHLRDKELKILIDRNQNKSELIIDINIKFLNSSTIISEQMIITAGLNSLFGGPTHIDTIKTDIDISLTEENGNKKTRTFSLDHKKPYNSLYFNFPFIDYYFLNLKGFHPMYSIAYENFIVESTLELLKNEN